MSAGSTTTSFMDSVVEMFVQEGFICMIVVNPYLGHLCGYVIVPNDHPIVGHRTTEPECTKYLVHGGVTFNEPFSLGGWIVGMDCNHFCDYAPYLNDRSQNPENEKGRAYVKKQLQKLARQLKWDYTFRA